MAISVILLFCLGLVVTIAKEQSLLWALLFGYGLFLSFGKYQGLTWSKLFSLSLAGIKTVSGILTTFAFIGLLMASWRACGVIAYIVDLATSCLVPSVFLPCIFILNSLISFLMGSSFATAATMGVVSMSIALTMGFSAVLTGGAILAGAYFGDRCSPVSTSALLVATITKTNLYSNIRAMLRTGFIPFCAAIILSLGFNLLWPAQTMHTDIGQLFAKEYTLNIYSLLPAIVLLILIIKKCAVRVTLGVSTLMAIVLCLSQQGFTLQEMALTLLFGFSAHDADVARLMNGGGLVSMLTVAGIVCISSSYIGIFQETKLLHFAIKPLHVIAQRISPFAAYALSSLVCCALACNQTLAIMLVQECTASLGLPPEQQALNIEDSCVVIAALLPWCIACAVPLSTINAPHLAIAAAFYLWLLPLTRLLFNHRD